MRRAKATAGGDVILFLQRQHPAADQPRIPGPEHGGQGDGGRDHPAADTGRDGGGKDQRRKGQKQVGQPHQCLVHQAADIARDQPDGRADDRRHAENRQRNRQRHPRPGNDARQHVAPDLVGAHPVFSTGRLQPRANVHLQRIKAGDMAVQQPPAQRNQRQRHDKADNRQRQRGLPRRSGKADHRPQCGPCPRRCGGRNISR